MNRFQYGRLLMAATLVLAVADARAGRSCERNGQSVQAVEKGLALAERTAKALDASGSEVVILARAGQDLSRYGVHYSHFGFAYRQPDGHGGYVWRVLHKLNQCGADTASIYRQGLGDFFMDDLWRYEAAYIVPSPEMEARLIDTLRDDRLAVVMHQRRYSMVSYAWGTRYQQSNQWVLETMAMAMEPAAKSRAQAQQWLMVQAYRPATLHIGPMTRLGARLTKANVAFDDHPFEKRFADRIETVTVDSVFAWMEARHWGGRIHTVGLDR